MPTPTDILDLSAKETLANRDKSTIEDAGIRDAVAFVCRNIQNRAGVLLLACLLAKVHKPTIDIRMPYTEIGSSDSYSGRTYDEAYIGPFVNKHQLPCNPTTAFLTPALRNRNAVLTKDLDLVGRPPELYRTVLELLSYVHEGNADAGALLREAIRVLFLVKVETELRMDSLLLGLKTASHTSIPLSSENIVRLIQQHLECKRASRLPVLVVAAAYTAAEKQLGERIVPLESHNAADLQTGSLGDVEVTLINDDKVVTTYEMKMKRVVREDIDHALNKIRSGSHRVDNYIFITTDVIESEISKYAASLYDQTGGIEFVVLDCLGFLRHFLHLFHRLRQAFLESYQEFLLVEPDSAVRQELKEAFLALRQAAESATAIDEEEDLSAPQI
ncbi:MAG: DNA methyltransferase [Bryobacteraceae bacterium]